jgi:hypothetical protein
VDIGTDRRWVSRCGDAEVGQSSLTDAHRTGRASTAETQHNNCRVGAIIRGDRRATMDELCSMLSISKGGFMDIIKDLGCSKVCARWVPRMLTDLTQRSRIPDSCLVTGLK